jgi:hypothetical protein
MGYFFWGVFKRNGENGEISYIIDFVFGGGVMTQGGIEEYEPNRIVKNCSLEELKELLSAFSLDLNEIFTDLSDLDILCTKDLSQPNTFPLVLIEWLKEGESFVNKLIMSFIKQKMLNLAKKH